MAATSPDDVGKLMAGKYPLARSLHMNILNERAVWERMRPLLKVGRKPGAG